MKSPSMSAPSPAHFSTLLAAALTLSLAACTHSLASWSSSTPRPDAESTSAPDPTSREPRADDSAASRDTIATEDPQSDAFDEDEEEDDDDDGGAAAAPSPAAASGRSIQLRSECSETVALLYADGSTDTTTRLDPGEVESHTFRPGAQVWVLDASEHKLASASITESVREVTVGNDCTSVSAR
jgi:hypothetical protein